MKIRVVCDFGAVRAIDLGRVLATVGDMISNEIHPALVADPYAKYLVEPGKIDPYRIAQEHLARDDRSESLLLVLTSYDLKPKGMNFTFGATYGSVVSVVSTCRMGEDAVLTGVTSLHELFHQLGMVASTAPQHDNHCGMTGHCKNPRCLMRAVNNLAELRAVAADWQQGCRLCVQCAGG